MSCLRVFMGWNVVLIPRGVSIRLIVSDVTVFFLHRGW